MRTVDPELWFRKVKKPILNVSRPIKFGFNEGSETEMRIRSSFQDAMTEYLRNCSVEGFGIIMDKKCPKTIRYVYLMLLLVTMVCGCIIVVKNCHYYWEYPRLMVNTQSVQHSFKKIDFPAVAICSQNVISHSGLNDYAKYLYSQGKNMYNISEIRQNLLAFSALHTGTMLPYDFRFIKYLKEIASDTNITNILYKMSPKCESMLLRCSWQSRRFQCRQIFATRLTNLGFCCIFNSRYHPIDRNNQVRKVNLVGPDAGLSVAVRENFDDFTSLRGPGAGVEVLLFDGVQYPLKRTGVYTAYRAAPNASLFLKLNARAQAAATSLQYYSDNWLGCHKTRGKESVEQTWSWCISLCRADAALALCQCVPHMLPPLDGSTVRACSLEHLACLYKHKEKFTFLYPGDNVHESLSEEQQDSVYCEHCRSPCERQRYSAEVTTVPYTAKLFLNRVFKGVDLRNTTLISVFYENEDQRLYLVEAGMRWYEILGVLSCQFVFVVGVTVVSIVELLYHFTFRWCHHYMRRRRRDRRLPMLKKTYISYE